MDAGVTKEVIKRIFEEVMKKYGVDTSMIPKENYPFNLETYEEAMKTRATWSYRYFRGQGFSKFKCGVSLCDHSWSSVHASCILDLKRQEIPMLFWQKCNQGHKDIGQLSLEGKDKSEDNTPGAIVYPTFDEKAIRRMVQWAVKLFCILTGRLEREEVQSGSYTPTAEHRQDLCQVCGILGRPCYERKQK